jgi:hypothetical protein
MTDELPTASPGAMATAKSNMAMGLTMDDELIVRIRDVEQVLDLHIATDYHEIYRRGAEP